LAPNQFNQLLERWNANELRREIPIAQVAYMLAETNRDREKHPRPFTIDQFLLVNRQPAKVATPEDQAKQMDAMVVFLEMLNARYGGKDLRKGAAA
jgi:hypothetical protein